MPTLLGLLLGETPLPGLVGGNIRGCQHVAPVVDSALLTRGPLVPRCCAAKVAWGPAPRTFKSVSRIAAFLAAIHLFRLALGGEAAAAAVRVARVRVAGRVEVEGIMLLG